jgi:Transglycosylase SLT domain
MAETNWNLLQVPDIGQSFMQGYQQGKQKNALAAYAQNPNDPNTLNALAPFAPEYVVQQKQAQEQQSYTRGQDQHKQQQEEAAKRAEMLGQAALAADTPEKWDQAVSYLSQYYPEVAQFKGQFSPGLREATIAAAGQMKTHMEQSKPIVQGPGAAVLSPDGKTVLQQAQFAPWHGTVGEGQTVVRDAGPSQPASVQSILPAIVAQESGGNYAAVNKDSGALGAYQVMPATAQSLAQRLGLPWRPDLMAAATPEAKQYQDAIGQAAVKEAVDASGGDPVKAAMYYHGGSDQSKWGPKTQAYGQQVAARLGGGAQVIAKGPPKQEKPKDAPAGFRWKADGTLEPIPGGPADKTGGQGSGYSQSAIDAFNRAILSARELYDPFTGKAHDGFATGVGMPSLNPLDGNLAGYIVPGSPAANFRTKLNTLKAQVFLPMVQSMKGMGALSNAEGEKLTAAIGNLDPNQSEDAFKSSIKQIITDLETYRNRATKPPQANNAPRAKPATGGNDVDAILRKHGVIR